MVPGWGGTASIKWVTEIRVTNKRVWTRVNTKGEAYIGPTFAAPENGPDDEYMPGITAADVKGPMVTWMPPKSFITVPLVIEQSPSLPANYPLKKGEVPKLGTHPARLSITHKSLPLRVSPQKKFLESAESVVIHIRAP